MVSNKGPINNVKQFLMILSLYRTHYMCVPLTVTFRLYNGQVRFAIKKTMNLTSAQTEISLRLNKKIHNTDIIFI